MKKLFTFFLVLISVLCLIGCDQTSKDLQKAFPEYYNLDVFKGIEVYVWQTENGEYRCGAMSGTNRSKTIEEITALTRNSASIEEMKQILSSYHVDEEYFIIIPITITSSDYEIVSSDFEKINEVFWGR